MKFIDLEILNQLKDITINVSKRRCKNTMGQMFCIESAFIKKNLLAWFNKKIKSILFPKLYANKRNRFLRKKINALFVKCH